MASNNPTLISLNPRFNVCMGPQEYPISTLHKIGSFFLCTTIGFSLSLTRGPPNKRHNEEKKWSIKSTSSFRGPPRLDSDFLFNALSYSAMALVLSVFVLR